MNVSPPPMAVGTPGRPTSPWFALHYVHENNPNISVHDLIQLVASIGAETKGNYTYQSVVNATHHFQSTGEFPSVGTRWRGYVGKVIVSADRHGHKNWIEGFTYSPTDIPGTGGPSTIQKGAIGLNNVGSGIGGALGGLGSLFGKDLLPILIIVVVLVLVMRK